MACDKPLKARVVGIDPKTGKKILEFMRFYDAVSFDTPEYIDIPCGQCIGCRLDYSREWANRCMLELDYHDSAYFVTLTYADRYIPMVEAVPEYFSERRTQVCDMKTGEYLGGVLLNQTLFKRDFQLFMKRLRKRFPNDRIRYYACGEYGGKTMRPHFHAIIYGLHLDDLEQNGCSKLGHKYFNSEKLEACWIDTDDRYGRGSEYKGTGELLGFVTVAGVTWDTCAYTARYMMKKLKGGAAAFYEKNNIVPEFTLMSRKPGIARQYYEDHKEDVYRYDEINLRTEKGGRKIRPPKYYDALFDVDDPDAMLAIKNARARNAEIACEAKLANTSLTEEELRDVSVRNRDARIKSLRRNLYG